MWIGNPPNILIHSGVEIIGAMWTKENRVYDYLDYIILILSNTHCTSFSMVCACFRLYNMIQHELFLDYII